MYLLFNYSYEINNTPIKTIGEIDVKYKNFELSLICIKLIKNISIQAIPKQANNDELIGPRDISLLSE